MCSPSGFAGPQPQHALFGAYFSWSDCSLIGKSWIGFPEFGGCAAFHWQRVEDNAFHLISRVSAGPDICEVAGQHKGIVAESADYDHVAP